jgi:hypothetical protein
MIETRRARCLVVAAALLGMPGCVIDLKLRPDGWCKLRMVYELPGPSTVAMERRRFDSPHVRIASLVLRDDQTAVVEAAVDDVTKLNTIQLFGNVVFARSIEDGDERLTATFTNPMPRTMKDEGKPGPEINVTLPGPVREANWNATVSGDHVRWAFSLVEFVKQPRIDLSVRYARPAAR